ncbi:hypothetical protein GOP47_0002705 [Adiantum capillus-veneris]|uniref:Uncharacterized protein n=1 Tax=Adiantum capillus-veneris TaxID=13818 RepID=A0A9D4VCK8_ADICA|nr:hypothetical protein GOP47_0002705 [Adiantum capillus-veneris]
MEKVAEDESMESMMAALFQAEDDDDEEIKQLQAHIQTLAAKAQEYSSHGPALISSRLQTYLQNRRPLFTPDLLSDSELLHPTKDGDDPSIAQAKTLKAQIVTLTDGIPALVQRMKNCLDACEKKQRLAEESKQPLPCFFQDVHKVWESLSPCRG